MTHWCVSRLLMKTFFGCPWLGQDTAAVRPPAYGQPLSRALQIEDASLQAGVGEDPQHICSLTLPCPGLGQLHAKV